MFTFRSVRDYPIKTITDYFFSLSSLDFILNMCKDDFGKIGYCIENIIFIYYENRNIN